jgi:hypothetical protein
VSTVNNWRKCVALATIVSGLLVIVAAVSGCASKDSTPELVLGEGVRLTAKAAPGDVSVVTGKGLARSYQWKSCSLSANMMARPARWFGSLGLYDPAASLGILSRLLPWWFKCDGVSRTVVQEGQIHFLDRDSAEKWITRYSKGDETVWSNNGLLVKWGINREREQIDVDVWQVCISGRWPTELAGARDESLVLSQISGAGPARHECAMVDPEVARNTLGDWQNFWQEIDNWPKGR